MAAVQRENLVVRIEPALKAKLVESATRGDRSINREAVRILREGLERPAPQEQR